MGEVGPQERGRLARMRSGQDAHGPVQPALHTFFTPTSPTFNYTHSGLKPVFGVAIRLATGSLIAGP